MGGANHYSLSQKTILLAGSGRSGTTWLGNILGANLNYRVVFEPFDEYHVPEAAVLPRRAYLRPDEDYPGYRSFIQAALSGRISNAWIEQEGRRPWAWKILVKEIRANLMLGWVSNHLGARIVYIIRHPCAVVLSRLKLKWDSNPARFLAQPELVEDYIGPYVSILENARTTLQKHAVSWAVENMVPLLQMHRFDWTFVTYERLYLQPEAETRRMITALQMPMTLFASRALKRVSSVTRADSAILQGRNPLIEWQRQLEKDQISEILNTVEQFGVDLYGPGPLPKTTELAEQEMPGFAPTLIDGMVG